MILCEFDQNDSLFHANILSSRASGNQDHTSYDSKNNVTFPTHPVNPFLLGSVSCYFTLANAKQSHMSRSVIPRGKG